MVNLIMPSLICPKLGNYCKFQVCSTSHCRAVGRCQILVVLDYYNPKYYNPQILGLLEYFYSMKLLIQWMVGPKLLWFKLIAKFEIIFPEHFWGRLSNMKKSNWVLPDAQPCYNLINQHQCIKFKYQKSHKVWSLMQRIGIAIPL